MRAPSEMEVIQIEITNACVRTCSNCTRFCGHHKKPFFMDFDTFKRAVDSLEGYTGVVGIMGGEPTIHPLFEQFTLYLNEKFKTRDNLNAARKPLNDFLTYTRAKHNVNRVLNKCAGPGLWTSITSKYYEHYELIQDVFTFQSLNDHSKKSYHHPLLVSRKDLRISDEQWLSLRDKCWIQNCWSASITPKGAFFCEVAASLDMLFGGNGGWRVENGWWKITPDQFGEQLKWCEMCGGALTTFRRDASEGITDVTPTLMKELEKIGSPLIKKGKINVFGPSNFESTKEYIDFNANQYIDDFSNRMSASSKYLTNLPIFTIPNNNERLGITLYRSFKDSTTDWLCFGDSPPEMLGKLQSRFLNNGILYKLDEKTFVFNRESLSLRKFGTDRVLSVRNFEEIIAAYPKEKRVNVDFDENVIETDEFLWRKHIDNDFISVDRSFRTIFENVVSSKAEKGSEIFVTQTASYFLTRGLCVLLKDMGYKILLLTHTSFKSKFDDVLEMSEIVEFSNSDNFDYEKLAPLLDTLKNRASGAIIPYSVPRSEIVAEDGYQNIEKCVRHVSGVICRINIKRDFVKINFDIDGDVYRNQWGY